MFNLNAILNIVGANTSSVKAAVADINSEMDRGTRKARSFADAVALKGSNLGVFAVASTAVIKLTESISMATRDALRFEVEMAKIAQTVGISTTEARKHGEEIRKLSVLYGLSAPKIAETVRVLAQAGYTLRQAKEAADNLSQTTLLSSFESITDTTDGLIAVNKQFIDTIGKSAQVLSLFNVVSKKYAVESADLVEVVRKAGGTFSATGGKLEELLAVFTTVRDTTRESAETIAVGLRTIFTRLQRPKTIEYLQQFGIELVNLEGQFVGNFEAIQRIQRGLDAFGVRPGSIKFAEVVEEIGGVLQQSRVIPLLTQGAKLQQVYADAQSASSETAMDLAKAQDTLSFKIAQTQQNFAKLIGDIASSKGFDTLVRGVLSMTNAMIHFAAAIKDVLPLISALLAFNLAKSVGKLALGGPQAFLGKKFATGGFVPGSGSGDTVPAMLTPGEFVVRKSAAQAMGAEALHGINKYAKGGPVKGAVRNVAKSGQILSGLYDLSSPEDTYSGTLSVDPLSSKGREISWGEVEAKGRKFADSAVEVYNRTEGSRADKVNMANRFLKRKSVLGKFALEYKNKVDGRNMFAGGATTNLVNNLKGAYAEKIFQEENPRAKKLSASRGIDFETRSGFVEIKSTIDEVGESLILAKALKAKGLDAKAKKNSYLNEQQDEVNLGNIRHVRARKFASGGSVGTDTVPSLLTPGEFVVNKKSAQAFGYGNLHKVNKYATGGVVGVQRFASGGPVGGEMLPGLSGLGDLAIVVNQLIPALGNATASFAAISVQGALLRGAFSTIAGTGKGVSDFYTSYKAEAARLSQVRADEYAAYKEANNKYVTATTDLRAAMQEVVLSKTILPVTGTAAPGSIAADFQERDIEAASKRAKASVAGVASQNFSQPEVDEANDRLTTSINKLIARYGSSSGQVKEAEAIQKSLNGTLSPYNNNIKAAADAVEKYTELVDLGAVEQRELVNSLKDQRAAARKTMRENGKSFSSRLGSAASGTSKFLSTDNKATQALATGAAAGMAALAASASSAADAAKRLSEEAIASGDAQGAYTNSLKATAQEQKSSAIEQGASIGGAIGSLFGPMGMAIGTAVGGLLGFTGAITYITDLLGITASEADAKAKAQEQRRAGALVKADKISSTAVSKSAEVRRFDPNRANSILAKGVKDLKDYNASEGSIANKDIQEQSKALFSASSSAIEELSQKAVNTGKSFDQLAKENTVLFGAWKTSGDMIEGNTELMRGMISQHNAVATLAQKERATRLAAINLQLRQLSVQKQINTSLAHMDSVIKTQNEALMGFGAALGEDYSPSDIGVDLTDLSNRNTSNPDYARGLSSVSSLGGPFAQEAAILGRAIPAVSGLADRLVNQNSDEQITQSLGGLPPKMIEEIMKRITDARAEAKSTGTDINPADIQQEIIDKVIKPITENVENGRKAINTQLQNQLSILKKQSELQKKQLEYRLAGLDAEREISDTIDKVRGTEADPRAERAARLNRAGTILQGTSLQGANLAGDKSDVDKIGKALAAAELRKQRVVGELQTVEKPEVRARLDEEMVGLTKETERLNEAMSSLGDVSKENAAIEAKIAKNQEKRGVVREAASNLAFGSGQDRKDFFRTLNQARGVAAFGTADVLRDKDKGGVFSFLKQMKDIPAFGGKTGQEVIDTTTRNYLLNGLKVPAQKVEEIMAKMIPSEEQALKLMTDNMTVDVARNALLVKILAALGGDIGFMKDPGQIAQVAKGMSTGGPTNTIFKPKGTDTIPAMLSPGEYVVSAKNAKNNMGTLAAINSGQTKYLAEGSGGSFKRSGSLSKNDRAKAEERAIAKLARQGVTSNESELAKRVRSQPQSFEATIPVAPATPEIPVAPTVPAMATQSEPSPTHDQQKLSADIISQGMRAKNERADRDAAFDRQWKTGLGKNATAEDHADERNNYLLNKIQRAKDTMRDGVYAERTANEANDQERFDKQLNSVAEMGTASSSVDARSNIRSTIGNFGANSAENKASVAPLNGYDGRLATDYGYSGMSQEQKEVFRKKVAAQRDALTSGATRTGVDKRFGADSILTYGVTEEGIKSGLSGASGYGNKLGLNSYEQAAAGYKPADMLIASQRRDKGRGFRSTEGDKAAASTKRKMLQDRNSPEYFAYKAELDAKIAAKKLNNIVRPPANIAGGTKSDRKIRSKSTGPSYSDRQKASRSRVKASRIKNSRTAPKDKFNQMFNVALPQASPVGPTEEYGPIAQNQFLPARLSAEEQAAKDAAMEAERMPSSYPETVTQDQIRENARLKRIEEQKQKEKEFQHSDSERQYNAQREQTAIDVAYSPVGVEQRRKEEVVKQNENAHRQLLEDAEKQKAEQISIRQQQAAGTSGSYHGFHNGGILGGMPGRDKNLIMAERGEGILRNEAMKKIGPANFNQLNKTGEAPVQPRRDKAEMPDFSKLFDSLKTFGAQFNESVVKLVDMPKTFEINLASQGVNVNLNGAEFLAKLPELLRSTILDQIQSQIGTISSQVKKDLSTGK